MPLKYMTSDRSLASSDPQFPHQECGADGNNRPPEAALGSKETGKSQMPLPATSLPLSPPSGHLSTRLTLHTCSGLDSSGLTLLPDPYILGPLLQADLAPTQTQQD